MLDKRSKYALKFLVKECNDGSYKIIEIEDIVSHMPKKYKIDKQTIVQIMKYLENGDYISVKYADEAKYCISPLPFGRQYVESMEENEKNKASVHHEVISNAILVFVCALFGAFLGTLVYYLI